MNKLRSPLPCVNRKPQDLVVHCTRNTTYGVSRTFPTTYMAVPAVTGRLNSTAVPLFIHQFPAGIPQAFAQPLFRCFLSKSEVSPPELHTIFIRFISRFRACFFISFFVPFPDALLGRKGRKASGMGILRKTRFSPPPTTTDGGPHGPCTQNVARGTFFLSICRSLRRRRTPRPAVRPRGRTASAGC